MVAFDGYKRICRGCAGGATGTLPPAPAPGAHDTCIVHEDDFAGVRMNTVVGFKICEKFVAGGETDGGGAGNVGLVEHGDRHGVTDRDEVADVDEGVDGGDVAVFGEPSE